MAEKKKRGLGTGMSALFGEPEQTPAAEGEAAPPTMLPLSRVEPRDTQPRKQFDPSALEELAESIRTYGMLQPITVRPLDSGYYQIIAGERRWRAARLAGLREVPVNIIEADDRLAAELALVENLQRRDLNPLEEAMGYRRLMNDYGLTQEEVAERVQKSRPAVANALRLLQLDSGVLELVEQGSLSAGHARALLAIADPSARLNAAREAVEKGLSVRQVEQLAKAAAPKKPAPKKPVPAGVDYAKETAQALTEAMGRQVKLSGQGPTGTITLSFYSADDRERLIAALKKIKL